MCRNDKMASVTAGIKNTKKQMTNLRSPIQNLIGARWGSWEDNDQKQINKLSLIHISEPTRPY